MSNSINVNTGAGAKIPLEQPSMPKGSQNVGAAMQALLGGKSVLEVGHTSGNHQAPKTQQLTIEPPNSKVDAKTIHQSMQAVFSPASGTNAYSPLMALMAIFSELQQIAHESTSMAIANTKGYAAGVQAGVEATKKGAVQAAVLESVAAVATIGAGAFSIYGSAKAVDLARQPIEVDAVSATPRVDVPVGEGVGEGAAARNPNNVLNIEEENPPLEGAQQRENQRANEIEEKPDDTTNKVQKRLTWGDPDFGSRVQNYTMRFQGGADIIKGLGQISSAGGQIASTEASATSQKYQGISNVLEKEEQQSASSVSSAHQNVGSLISDMNAIMEASANELGSASQVNA